MYIKLSLRARCRQRGPGEIYIASSDKGHHPLLRIGWNWIYRCHGVLRPRIVADQTMVTILVLRSSALGLPLTASVVKKGSRQGSSTSFYDPRLGHSNLMYMYCFTSRIARKSESVGRNKFVNVMYEYHYKNYEFHYFCCLSLCPIVSQRIPTVAGVKPA